MHRFVVICGITGPRGNIAQGHWPSTEAQPNNNSKENPLEGSAQSPCYIRKGVALLGRQQRQSPRGKPSSNIHTAPGRALHDHMMSKTSLRFRKVMRCEEISGTRALEAKWVHYAPLTSLRRSSPQLFDTGKNAELLWCAGLVKQTEDHRYQISQLPKAVPKDLENLQRGRQPSRVQQEGLRVVQPNKT